MLEPEFPEEFVKNYCPKVLECREWGKHFGVMCDGTDMAECAFVRAGYGMECESCRLFLTRPMRTSAEFLFLEKIEKFYEDMQEYMIAKNMAELESKCLDTILNQNMGSGI